MKGFKMLVFGVLLLVAPLAFASTYDYYHSVESESLNHLVGISHAITGMCLFILVFPSGKLDYVDTGIASFFVMLIDSFIAMLVSQCDNKAYAVSYVIMSVISLLILARMVSKDSEEERESCEQINFEERKREAEEESRRRREEDVRRQQEVEFQARKAEEDRLKREAEERLNRIRREAAMKAQREMAEKSRKLWDAETEAHRQKFRAEEERLFRARRKRVHTTDSRLALLGLNKGATKEDIKKAYRIKSKECHPDLNPNKDSNEFIKLKKTYEELINE